MEKLFSYTGARDLLLQYAQPIGKEHIPLKDCAGRVLGQDVTAIANVPPFDRSPYDGYAFRAADSVKASRENPVTLHILEEIPAGGISHFPVTEGTAVKILTGAPIPEGADAVVPYEVTEFTEESVTIFAPSKSGSNIIRTGEDVKMGAILAEKGVRIDAGLSGTLASQNIAFPEVYKIPKIGIISTGSELVEVGEELEPGKIYNSNQYTLGTVLKELGCEPMILGNAIDSTEKISELIVKGLEECEALFLTGGVSVGDYDLTPAAMEMAGVEILFRGVSLKPGMACAYGVKDGKLVCGLSGNPASAITNYYAIAQPAIRKICGFTQVLPAEIEVSLAGGFGKKSRCTRLLRGKLDLSDGTVKMQLPTEQGNVVLSSTIGCNVMAIVPEGSGPLPAGTKLKGFLI